MSEATMVSRIDALEDIGIAILSSARGDWVVTPADAEACGVLAGDGGVQRGLDGLDALGGIDACVRAVSGDYDDVEIAEVSRRRRIAGYDPQEKP